jgi:hypothetical protein
MEEMMEISNSAGIERILVQLADRQWTLDATHLACQIARVTGAEIVFIKMVSVQHIGWLGTELGYVDFTEEDYNNLQDYAATAEDYSVPCAIQRFQYITFVEGISQAAEYFGARLIFATPVNVIKIIRRIQNWQLRRILNQQNRQLSDSAVVEAILSANRYEHQTNLHDLNVSL